MSVGTCAFCDDDYIVSVDSIPACKAHIRDAMKVIRAAVGATIREALVKAPVD